MAISGDKCNDFELIWAELGPETEENIAGMLEELLSESQSLLETLVGRMDVEENINKIFDTEFDEILFKKHVPYLDDSHKIKW